jgi:ankyrin repeat protein
MAALIVWRLQAAALEHAVLTKALVSAVQNRDSPEVNRLLRAGADANCHVGSDPPAGLLDRIALLLSLRGSEAHGDPLLVEAVYRGNPTIVRALLENGANPNSRDSAGVSPLRHARTDKADEIVSLLIAQGARD